MSVSLSYIIFYFGWILLYVAGAELARLFKFKLGYFIAFIAMVVPGLLALVIPIMVYRKLRCKYVKARMQQLRV